MTSVGATLALLSSTLVCLCGFTHAGHSATARSPIWFVSWQHTGHIKALCPIAAEMMKRGWDARVAVHEEMAEQVSPGLPVESAGPLPWSWEQELRFRSAMWDPEPAVARPSEDMREADARKAQLSEQYFSGSQRSLAEGLNATLQELPRQRWPVLLVVDVSSVGAMDLAEQLGLPFAVVSGWPVGPTLQSIGDDSAFSFPWLPSELFAFTQAAHQHSFFDRLKRFVFTAVLPRIMEFQGFHEPRRAMRRDFGLSSQVGLLEVPRMKQENARPLVIVLSHWGFDRPRPLPPNVMLVGPVENYTSLAQSRLPLVDKVASWLVPVQGTHLVYVSFGTNVKPKTRMLRELIKGMARLRSVRFLWDASAAEIQKRANSISELPTVHDADDAPIPEQELDLPENVLFVPKVDQISVLSSGKVDAFVSHCGMNSVHEAMHFGVPIIGAPFLGDQLISAYLVEEAGAGVRLSVPRISAQSFEEAVRRVITLPQHRTNAQRVGRLASHSGGVMAAADAMEAIVEHGVTHLQMMRDTQAGSGRLWDVYIVLSIVFFVVFCCTTTFVASLCCPHAALDGSAKEKSS